VTSALDGLAAAVIADPAGDAPRVAYADAIGVSDPERAELIRLQLAMASARRHGKYATQAQKERAKALIAKHGKAWAGRIADRVRAYEFSRGFVEHVTMPAADFLAFADELFRVAPIRHLTLVYAKGQTAKIAASPALARLVSLHLPSNDLGDDDVAALVASPHLGGLSLLDLAKNAIGRAGAEAIVAAPALAKLRHLDFRGNKIDLVPRAAGVDYDGSVQDVEVPPLATELQSRYGRRAYLLGDGQIPHLDAL
jgi:uncharacterized protein (TIGR02996 family)